MTSNLIDINPTGNNCLGTIITVIGALFFAAFTNADPLKATGIDGVLLSLLKLPLGRWILGLIALGLVSYGVYLVIRALWLRTRPSKGA